MARPADEAREDLLARLAGLAEQRQPGEAGDRNVEFLRQYYAETAYDDLAGVDLLDLYGAALHHRELAARRQPGTAAVEVLGPRFEQHGFASRHAVVQVVTDDMPFVTESVRMALSARGLGIHLIHHPVIGAEAFVHVEIDRHAVADAEAVTADLVGVLGDDRHAVEDWPAMVADLDETIARLTAEGAEVIDGGELAEAVAFLRWLADDNFTFLGARSYTLEDRDEQLTITRVGGTGLGILREDPQDTGPPATKLSPKARRLALLPTPLTLTKANSRSTVHRPTYLDYVGVKQFDGAGRVVGERRYLGLFTSRMHTTPPRQIPLLRRKVEAVLERSGVEPLSHSGRDLAAILENYPRDELVQIGIDDLFAIAMGIHYLQERRRTRLFLRRDEYGRSWTALVYLPRDRYNTTSRAAVQQLLTDELGGSEATFDAFVSDSVLTRLHYVVRGGSTVEEVDAGDLERRIAELVRDWSDDLHDQLIEEHGEDVGVELADRYRDAFGPGYRSEHPARTAVADIDRLEAMPPDALDAQLYRPVESPQEEIRLRIYRTGPPVLVSDLLPVLEHFGARVADQRPFAVQRRGGGEAFIYDVGLRVPVDVDVIDDGPRVVGTLHTVWTGRTQSDGFHKLVLGADLTWREISFLRAYAYYLRQAGTPFSLDYLETCVTAHPMIARKLVALFHARFDPAGGRGDEVALGVEIEHMLDGVASLDEDRVLRSILGLVRATLRTNAYQAGVAGEPKRYLSFKLDSRAIPDLPLPRPHVEIFVHSPQVEGVHLRGATVARGGLRWSDRREDYRTEVLGLMKAQMVKNAVIVPAGAKGGFVVKNPPSDPVALRAEVVECYKTYLRGLLDITDDISGGDIEVPPQVVRHDGDDPYLVVAADKGTATFSDIANGVAAEYDFWLGDAFASGGSAGYDHKAMGITARGAWEAVKRHFREVGVDVATDPFTVVGIGDMAGDVFGNGMLLSPQIRLVAAFNHMHVFLDPDPDAAASFAERQRLFELPRSTWDDYDQALLSPGGGVFPRAAKSVTLSAEIKARLGIDAAIEALTPNELIRAILHAPVDLLWNGGIGTYVKAGTETNAEVGDKTNDALRVDGADLRCRVVAEGGNLGLTQRGRIEYARAGGRINTDAIDNSAGVDCSDHEVNIKIVLDGAVVDGDLTPKQRNALLVDMTGEVAELVLAHNVRQNRALVNAAAQAPSLVGVHQRYLRYLEQVGGLDRAVEFLPTDEELTERKAAGVGLTGPEFAVLLAYTKIVLVHEVLQSPLPDEAWCDDVLLGYFPTPLRERFADRIRGHRLHREIIATVVVNEVVDAQGITALYRIQDETGASAADATAAMMVATAVFDLRSFRAEVAALDHQVPSAVQTQLALEARKLAERGGRWLVRNRAGTPLDATIARYRDGLAALTTALPDLLVGAEHQSFEQTRDDLRHEGVPEALARRAATFEELFAGLDCVDLAAEAGEPVETVAGVRFLLEDRLGLRWLQDLIGSLGRNDRWQTLARLSLREDLHAQLRRLTASVIGSTDGSLAPADRVEAWVQQRTAPVERLTHVLADVRAVGSPNLATLSVGMREVAQLA